METLARAWLRRRGVLFDLLPAVLAIGLMFWGGLVPLKSLPGPDFELADKVWHGVAFGGLAGLLSRSFVYFGQRPLRAAQVAALLAMTLGGVLEVLQSLTAWRSADWADWVADNLGVALAYAVLVLLIRAAPEAAPVAE